MNAQPIAQSERIILLDVLRGFAIFGILMVNMPLMFEPITSMMLGAKTDVSIANKLSEIFIKFFFEGKFYVIFSMLFGYGFWIFINKSSKDGQSIIPVFRRRVFFLLLFGLFHVVFLWAGDILVFYALFGFVLLLFRKVSDRGLIKWAIWIGLIPTILSIVSAFFIYLGSLHPEAQAEMTKAFTQSNEAMQGVVSQATEAYTNGNYFDSIKARIIEYQVLLPGVLFFYPMVLGMFLIGVWAARIGVLANYTEHLSFFKKTFWWGLIVGTLFSISYAYTYQNIQPSIPGPLVALNTASHTIGGFFLGLFYVSAIAFMAAKGKIGWFAKIFAPVGRMALSNYLMHSIISAILFLPFGFGLFGKIALWQGILLTVAIFAIQIPLSRYWLSKFHFGPFEWLWRSLTYLKLQPFVKF
jgi:uncharacterized protein